MKQISIAIVIPYFGRFNNYFRLWLESAKNNPTIDFLLFTDQEVDSFNNIKVFKSSLQDVSNLAQRNLSAILKEKGLPIISGCGRINKPYKLCDYKPIYGIIFKQYLKNYDFWGHCDVDLIFGNIRHFITPEILYQYDRILSCGHFSLYKNTYENNLKFLNSRGNLIGIPSYEQVYSSDKSFSFDEWPGMSKLWSTMNWSMYNTTIFDDIYVLRKHFISCQKIEKDFGISNVIFAYNNGHLFRFYFRNLKVVKEETMYVHLQKRPMKVETNSIDKYLIVPNKFIDYQHPSAIVLRKYGNKWLFYPNAIKIRLNNLKRKIMDKFEH